MASERRLNGAGFISNLGARGFGGGRAEHCSLSALGHVQTQTKNRRGQDAIYSRKTLTALLRERV